MQFKLAVATPIYKKGDGKDLNNYRPIFSITALAKIFEKAQEKSPIFWKKVNPQCVCSWISPRHLTLLVIVRCWRYWMMQEYVTVQINYLKVICLTENKQ
nr:unnamed protein product [Callosobruchus chinensis]